MRIIINTHIEDMNGMVVHSSKLANGQWKEAGFGHGLPQITTIPPSPRFATHVIPTTYDKARDRAMVGQAGFNEAVPV